MTVTAQVHKAELHDSETSSLSSLDKDKDKEPEDRQPATMPHQFEPLNTVPTSGTTHGTHTNHNADLVNLPSRTLEPNASLEEYTEETVSGQILKQVRSNKSGKIERWELVTFKIGDAENPKNWSKAFKWWCTMCVALTCFVVALNSAVVTADIGGVAEEFGCSEEVALLSVTLFVVGFGIGTSKIDSQVPVREVASVLMTCCCRSHGLCSVE